MTELPGVYASFDHLTPAIADQLWADGYRVFSQQLWTAAKAGQPEFRVENLRIAHDKGFKLVGPIAINGSQPGTWHVAQAREGVPQDLWDALLITPIDVELEGIPNPNIRDAVEATVALGKRRSMYLSVHTWNDYQDGPDGFKDCLIYVAQYDNVNSMAFVRLPASLDGAFIVGKQFTNSMDTDGLTTCREVWNDWVLVPGTSVPAPIPAVYSLESHETAIQFLSKVMIAHQQRLDLIQGAK
jgi:hypothetical protein